VVLVAAVLVVGCGGAGGFGGSGCGDVVVVAAAVVATAAEVRRWWATTYGRWARVVGFGFFIVFQKSLPRAISALGTRVPSGIHLALGIGLFAGAAVPSELCREFPLCTGCAESTRACAERSSLLAHPQIPVVPWLFGQIPKKTNDHHHSPNILEKCLLNQQYNFLFIEGRRSLYIFFYIYFKIF
jgi:hypothetical protein